MKKQVIKINKMCTLVCMISAYNQFNVQTHCHGYAH